MTKAYILNFFKTHQSELKEKYSIIKFGLFGSYATGKATSESDIDLYIEFENKKFKNIAGAWNYLEKAFGKKIDLFYPHKNMRPSLRESIENEVIYG